MAVVCSSVFTPAELPSEARHQDTVLFSLSSFHSLVEELLQSDSEVALRHAVASDFDEFVSGESALDLRGTEQSGVTVKTTTSTNTEHLR